MIFTQHNHGGQLQLASQMYSIPLDNWLDLSTGISPFIYPLPVVPKRCWQRLPEVDDGLEEVASNYYGSPCLLPVSGSQEAIQSLPQLFSNARVGIIEPAYHSHQQAWLDAGHHLITLKLNEVEKQLSTLDVLIVVNPTNPTAQTYTQQTLMKWHHQLAKQKGCLIVDEAFMDATPEQSLIQKTPLSGLIVLRSIGKFFGMAGIRLGFVWAEKSILEQLAKRQNDWSVSHPARWAGVIALRDMDWQHEQRRRLFDSSEQLQRLLNQHFHTQISSTALFGYFQHEQAPYFHEQLAQQGIITRLFKEPLALRFGLPADEEQWLRLEEALVSFIPQS